MKLLTNPLFPILGALVLFVLLGARAPTVGGFYTVTFTRTTGEVWVDSGVILEDHEFRDPRNIGGKEYTYRFIVFPDHVNEYHLDQGRVDVVAGR